MAIYDFFVSRNNSVSNTAAYVGHPGRLFYDSNNGVIKISNGMTPGGVFIPYNIATTTTVGGIKAGPGANVSPDGTLTIDTTGLPLSIGNLDINNSTISVINLDQDLILESSGNGNVDVIGQFRVFHTNGNIAGRNPDFLVKSDGQITIRVPIVDPNEGAVRIIGSTSGNVQTPVNPGVMLQATGPITIPSRIYNDAIGAYSGYISRRFNGNATIPTQVLVDEEISRFGINAFRTGGWLTGGQARISFISTDNQDLTNNGAKIDFYSTPRGTTTASIVKVLSLDGGYGANVAGRLDITGNLTVGGNLIGNSITTTAIIGTANVSTLNNAGDSIIGGNVRYSISSNHATVTQLTSKSTSVTANGRSGQITTNNATLGQGAAVTFTVNNSYVSANDVVILSIQSGATANTYVLGVGAVATGSFSIQIRNFSNSAQADAIVINFAVIKIA